MKTLNTLRQEREDKTTQLLKDCSVFFAFSKEQFEENKTEKKEGEKYTAYGYGAYSPSSQVDNYMNGLTKIMEEYDQEIQENGLRRAYILYELNNHEAFYTGELEPTHEALIGKYTIEEVAEVYRETRAKKNATHNLATA